MIDLRIYPSSKSKHIAFASLAFALLMAIGACALTGCAADRSNPDGARATYDGAGSSIIVDTPTVVDSSLTDKSCTIIWEHEDNAYDYHLTIEGGSTHKSEMASDFSEASTKAIASFYQSDTSAVATSGSNTSVAAQHIQPHAVEIDNLEPDTDYIVSIQQEDASGDLSNDTQSVTFTTKATTNTVSVDDCGAIADGLIQAGSIQGTDNTDAIQSAIDSCPSGGTVIIPSNESYVSGTLHLKSSITLDVEGTLIARNQTSASSYSATSNATTTFIEGDEGSTSIRIIGSGRIDGSLFTNVSPATASSTGPSLITMDSITQCTIGQGLTLIAPTDGTAASLGQGTHATLSNLSIDGMRGTKTAGVSIADTQKGIILCNDSLSVAGACVTCSAPENDCGNLWIFDTYCAHGTQGIDLEGVSAHTLSNITIEDTVFDGCGGILGRSSNGIAADINDITVQNCAFAHIAGSAFQCTNNGDGKATDPTLSQPCFHHVTISDCTVNGATGPFISLKGSPTGPSASDGFDHDITISSVSFTSAADTAEANASQLAYLRNATFDQLTFYGTPTVWNITNQDAQTLTDVTFQNKTPHPVVSATDENQ